MSGELDGIIDRLERAEQEATDVLDRYTDLLSMSEPAGKSWGVTKYERIMAPAGSRLNYLAALKQLREAFKTWPGLKVDHHSRARS